MPVSIHQFFITRWYCKKNGFNNNAFILHCPLICMKIYNLIALIGLVVSITAISGVMIPALAQPLDSNQTQPTLESLLGGNMTLSLGSNNTNETSPASHR